MNDSRKAIVAWAKWLQVHHDRAIYSESANRYANLNKRGILPFVGDCSSTVRDYYNWAGAPDPYGLGYGVLEGYTGTELSAGVHIALMRRNALQALVTEVRPGDAVVYGPGTGWHTALVVETLGANVLTISMGRQGDPSYVWVNPPTCPSRGYGYDGRQPQTYLRFPTLTKRVYWPAGDTPGPLPQVLRHLHFVRLGSNGDDWLARYNGWPVWKWDGTWFALAQPGEFPTTTEYANEHFATPRN